MKQLLLSVLCSGVLLVASDQPSIEQTFANLPLAFEPNRGQAEGGVQFLARGDGFTAFFKNGEATLVRNGRPARMRLIGSGAVGGAQPLDQQAGVSNYLMGRDRKNWQSGVPRFGRVQWKGVYPGIDVVYYGNQRKLEYDLVVGPGADPRQIELAWEGVDQVEVDQSGDLRLRIGRDQLRMERPRVYQQLGNTQAEVAAKYRLLAKNHVGIELAAYDPARTLVIDPAFGYSSYFGGTGSDTIFGIAVDAGGSAYICGETSSANLSTMGAIQGQGNYRGGVRDAFIAKLNRTGTDLIYSTYLGGAGDDTCNSIAVDIEGNAYIGGSTTSTDFPIAAALQPGLAGGTDSFVAKLASDGHSLVYSTYLGGSAEESVPKIALDSMRSLYVSGQTNSTNFPVTTGTLRTTKGGLDTDLYVTKIAPAGNALLYSTFLGGSGTDFPFSAAVDGAGNLFVAGYTESQNFPVTANALQTTPGGNWDGFVFKLNVAGSGLVYSSYLGGSDLDLARGVAVDEAGRLYVTGSTLSRNFPITADAFQQSIPQNGGNNSQAFVTKLNSNGADPIYSTYLGGTDVTQGTSIAVNAAGFAFLTGATFSPNFPLANEPLQSSIGSNGLSSFLTAINPLGSGLSYSSYLGRSGESLGWALTLDSNGDVYVAGRTSDTTFPTTGFQAIYGGGVSDGFVTKFTGFHFGDACLGALGASSLTLPASGGSGVIPVTAGTSCFWIAVPSTGFLTVPVGFIGVGSREVSYNAGNNPAATPRLGSISLAGNILHILQKGTGATVPFDDVPLAHPFVDYIQLMKANGVTTGCTATTYCPEINTTRGEMAQFIIRAMLGGDNFPFQAAPYFADVLPAHPQFKWIQKMKELGITSGCTELRYCPEDPVTRGQMAVFVVRGLLGNSFTYSHVPYFSDVPAGHPFFPYIQKMKEWGITAGCAASSYCPDDNTTRGQMAVFVIRGYFSPR